MKKRSVIISFLLISFLISNFNLQAQENILEKLDAIAIVEQKIMMLMRDGIRLTTDFYRFSMKCLFMTQSRREVAYSLAIPAQFEEVLL